MRQKRKFYLNLIMQKKNLIVQVEKDKYFLKKLVNNDYTMFLILEM